MSESSPHFDDMRSNESVSRVNIYDNSDDEDIYGDQSDVPNVSTLYTIYEF